MKHYNKIANKFAAGLMLAGLAGLGACQNDFDDPGLVTPEATLQANISISDFKKLSWDQNAMQLTGENSHGGYVIRGRVVSSDATGNIYQSLVIQDETAAIPITIRRASLFNEYHLGQQVVVNTDGLWLGKYNGLIQLGWLGEPYNGEPQLTFMSFAEFSQHAQLNGLPDPECVYVSPTDARPADKMYCQVLDIDQLPTSGEDMYNLQGQLVEFRNVSFDGGGELTFAPYQENANRYIKAKGGSLKLTVRNSGYATFYNNILPKGTGTVRGILSWYGDGTSSTDGVIGGWQLLLRSLNDLDFQSKGSEEDPYTIAEARAAQDMQRSGWVKGYVVGAVKAGVTSVTSLDDINLSVDVDINNNVVIAQSATSRSLEEMMVVNLPQGSTLRTEINLLENPAVYGRLLMVSGELTGFLGFPGVVGAGTSSDFHLDSDNPGGNDPVDGAGSENSPYSVDQVINSSADANDVWVTGYVVGYVDENSWPGKAVFGNTPSTSDNYVKGMNLILSDQPVGSCNAQNSIPVNLASEVRAKLAVGRNPAIYGKKVMLKGNLTNNMGVRGLKAVTAYKEL